MAARIVIPVDPGEATLESVANDCATLLRQHHERVTRVRIDRRRQGPGSGPLPEEIEAVREAHEEVDDHVRSIVELIIATIKKDAERPRQKSGKVGPWLGTVVLLNHLDKKPEIARIDVRIDDPDELPTLDSEAVQIVNVVGGFLRSMCKEMVAVMGAAAAREQAVAELVTGVAKSIGRESEARYKYEWKQQRSRERMDKHRVDREAEVHKSKARWETIGDFTHDWHDIAQVWSDWLTFGRRKGDPMPEPPKAPTREEIDSMLRGEEYDRLRALASEMIAEPDAKRRGALAMQFRDAWGAMPKEASDALRKRVLAELGEARAREILAWLHLPN